MPQSNSQHSIIFMIIRRDYERGIEMKDCRFQVWDIRNRELYPVCLIRRNVSGSITVNATSDPDEWRPIQVSGKSRQGILLQSIGRVDKNGRYVFEGDIVDCNRYSTDEIFRIVIKDIRSIPPEMSGSSLNSVEVVGNVFQNPDFLPKGLCDIVIKALEQGMQDESKH